MKDRCRALVFGGGGGSGGYVQHLKGLLCSGGIPEDVDVQLECSTELAEQLTHCDPRVVKLSSSYPRRGIARAIHTRASIQRALGEGKPDVVLVPAPFPGVRVEKIGLPCVVMAQNLLLFDRSELWRYFPGVLFTRLCLNRHRHKRAIQSAAGLIFHSEYSRRLIARAVKCGGQMTVVPHGAWMPAEVVRRESLVVRDVTRLLYVSTITAYKHQDHVIAAVANLSSALGRRFELTLIGKADAMGKRMLRQAASRSQGRVTVARKEFMGDEDLACEYRAADVFIFASTCETFGISLLEAMSHGLGIACSAKSSMREFLLDGGIYFDAGSVNDIEHALDCLVRNDSLRRRCGVRARRLAGKYTWVSAAQKTFAFLKQCGLDCSHRSGAGMAE